MTFETFLKHSLEPDDGTIFALSKFKRENPLDYAKYHDRIDRVNDFVEKDNNHRIDSGKLREKLTPKNFSQYEAYLNANDKLLGRDKPNITDSMKPMFDRLTKTEQTDLYYHCLLHGRVDKDGTVNYQQSDFDWLKSQDYQDILKAREANSH